MADHLPSDSKLDRLKRICTPMRGEPMRMVSRLELLALVECAELLDSVVEAQFTPTTQAEWLHKRKAVLAKLEAL